MSTDEATFFAATDAFSTESLDEKPWGGDVETQILEQFGEGTREIILHHDVHDAGTFGLASPIDLFGIDLELADDLEGFSARVRP